MQGAAARDVAVWKRGTKEEDGTDTHVKEVEEEGEDKEATGVDW